MATKPRLPLLLSRSLHLHHAPRSLLPTFSRLPLFRPQLQLLLFQHHHPPSNLRAYSSPPQQPPKSYTYEDIKTLSSTPGPSTLLVDVREPSELTSGRIPNSVSMPITSNPDAIYLSADDFYDRFGFQKPGASSSSASASGDEEEGESVSMSNPKPYAAGHAGADVGAAAEEEAETDGGMGDGEGEGVKEVVFFCKAGVRSRAAMQMALGEGGWRGVRVGQWGGGWVEWENRGGEVER